MASKDPVRWVSNRPRSASSAGKPAWTLLGHFTYAWKDDATPRVLTSETEIHQARDAGALDEFPGMPDTKGEIFTVNCPVPPLAPVSFKA